MKFYYIDADLLPPDKMDSEADALIVVLGRFTGGLDNNMVLAPLSGPFLLEEGRALIFARSIADIATALYSVSFDLKDIVVVVDQDIALLVDYLDTLPIPSLVLYKSSCTQCERTEKVGTMKLTERMRLQL